MKLGLGTYACAWSIGVPGYAPPSPMRHEAFLERTIGLGLGLAQFADNLSLADLEADALAALLERARQAGVAIETGARGLTEANLDRQFALARRCGSRLLRFVIDGPDWHPTLEDAAAIIRPRLAEFERTGVTLAIENHDRFLARDLARFIDRLGSAHAGICLDSVNSLGAGEGLETVVDCLAPHTVNLHIKDFTIRRQPHNMGFLVDGTVAGTGFLPIAELLERLLTFGRCATAALELWPPWMGNPDTTIAREQAWIDESLHHLRRWFTTTPAST